MHLITRHSIRRNQWRHVADEEALGSGNVTVSLRRWRLQRETLLARFRPVGVRLQPDDAVADIAADLDRLDLLALDFGSFADGRGYSQARQLRQQFGYRGELRALQARRDQLHFLARCGFDAFELHPREDTDAALAVLKRSATAYQPAADGQSLVFRRRRHAQFEHVFNSIEGARRR